MTHAHHTHPRHTHPRVKSKGSSTLIAILALFALLSLGTIAMRSTQQDIANAGNIKRVKQARALAEIGLQHAATLLQQQGSYLLNLRRPREVMTLRQDGLVRYWLPNAADPEAAEVLQREVRTPPFPALTEGPSPLDLAPSRVPSYEVRVSGLLDAGAPPGQELSQGDLGTPQQRFCLVELTSSGVISSTAEPERTSLELDERAWRTSLQLHVEQSLKASLTVGPFLISRCGP